MNKSNGIIEMGMVDCRKTKGRGGVGGYGSMEREEGTVCVVALAYLLSFSLESSSSDSSASLTLGGFKGGDVASLLDSSKFSTF